jgi:levansucrase
MALGSPRFPDPDERHSHARLHLLQLDSGRWTHLGPVLPDGFSPGSREWSGSAVLDSAGSDLPLYFTASGFRGEAEITFLQRLFRVRGKLVQAAAGPRLRQWHGLTEFVRPDPAWYMTTAGPGGGPGTIKAFRDPAYFRDPRSGAHYVFFAGALAGSSFPCNGVIGAAVADHDISDEWQILAPVISADGLNNELERPHVVHHGGAYYLFWSTQSHVFEPTGPIGPTGLYGMVSDRLDGGWQPLNGTGLVFANPEDAPTQAYSWLVLPELGVISFVDDWGPPEKGRSRRFGASFAPRLHLILDGDTAHLARPIHPGG